MDIPTILKPGFMKGTEKVPIIAILEIINKMIYYNDPRYRSKVMILKASTGSGKSTVVPAHLSMKLPKKILSAQPRVLNAISLPNQIIPYYPFTLGKNIGFHTGNSQKIPESGIIFVTNGILANIITNMTDTEICLNYSVILLDEAHELDESIINIHYFLKQFLKRNINNKDCPIIIITSATFDYQHFAKYYNTNIIVKVKGFTFEIKENFLKYTSENYLLDTVKIIKKINSEPVEQNNPKDIKSGDDILVFFAGIGDIIDMQNILDNFKIDITVLTLNREIIMAEGDNLKNLYLPATHFGTKRKIILATNVGETGITLPYIKHVIDTGFYRPKLFLPDINVYLFEKQPVTLFSAKQRKGRVGRITPGNFYGIYTENTYKALRVKLTNSFYYNDLSLFILILLKSDTKILDIDLIYKPTFSSIWYSVEKLYILGFIQPDLKLTELGNLATNITRLNIEQIKIIFSGYLYGAPIQDLIILSIIMYEDLNALKKSINLEYLSSIFTIDCNCDFIPFIEYYYNNALNTETLYKINETRDLVVELLANLGFNPYENYKLSYPNHSSNYLNILKQCIYEGLKLNLCTWNGHYYTDYYGNKIYEPFMCNYFVYNNLQFKTIYKTESIRKINIVGKSVLDGYINVAVDFL